MTSLLKTMAKLTSRRNRGSDIIFDHNADRHGRRPSGDPRLELAYFERSLHSRW